MGTSKTSKGSAPQPERRKRRTMSQKDMFDLWFESGIFIAKRMIYLGSVTTDAEGNESKTDAAMAGNFEKTMSILEYMGPKLPITIVMNNPGGDVYHALSIYDRIMDSNCHVTILATGHVMSMGSIILQAADRRVMTRNATMLLHYGTSSYDGTAIDHERSGDESKRLRAMMQDILLQKMIKKDPKITLQGVHQMLQNDTFMDASRAIRLGLADGLTPQPKHKKRKTRSTNPSE